MSGFHYDVVIGLEVHCQLSCESKLFCSCSTHFGALPNHHCCPVCLGLPGSLPVLNTKAVAFAIRFALAVDARINRYSRFARKQYFYPDLPKGYQISQHDLPYCEDGEILLQNGKRIGLVRAHLEEDAGKNVHAADASYVDLNRAGIPLLEIVSAPEISSPEEASEYLHILRDLVRYLEISDGNLEEGSFRCDANVSLKPKGATQLGTRCEIKNLNSFRNVEKAIRYEMLRQADLLDHGYVVEQHTLLYDPASGKTQKMRSKEDAKDYRYFNDPDLPPLVISPERAKAIEEKLPELPQQKLQRFVDSLKLSIDDARLLISNRSLAFYFERVVAACEEGVSPQIVANWINTELLRVLNEKQISEPRSLLAEVHLAKLLSLLNEGVISGKIAKLVFDDMIATGEAPEKIIDEKSLVQISDQSQIIATVEQVLSNSPSQVEEYLQGKEKLWSYFVGQIMRLSKGKFNPTMVNEVLRERLNARKKS